MVGLMEAAYSSKLADLKWNIASVKLTIGDFKIPDSTPWDKSVQLSIYQLVNQLVGHAINLSVNQSFY